MSDLPWRVAWVTGASTGIGRELAIALAKRGVIVAASARSAEKLAELGHGVRAYPLDVTDRSAVIATHDRINSEIGPIDLAVLAAGTYKPLNVTEFDLANFIETNAVNYLGVVHALSALIPQMRSRRSGHLACIASVAGYRGLPKAAAYGPSKAALINLAESLKPELEADGVTMTLINPGFVATPLTAQNEFPMPFLLSAEEAATRILRGLQRRRFEIAFPTRFVLMLKLARLLPYSVYFFLIRKFVISRKQSVGG
jgi:short-subunit dehydrogenase